MKLPSPSLVRPDISLTKELANSSRSVAYLIASESWALRGRLMRYTEMWRGSLDLRYAIYRQWPYPGLSAQRGRRLFEQILCAMLWTFMVILLCLLNRPRKSRVLKITLPYGPVSRLSQSSQSASKPKNTNETLPCNMQIPWYFNIFHERTQIIQFQPHRLFSRRRRQQQQLLGCHCG